MSPLSLEEEKKKKTNPKNVHTRTALFPSVLTISSYFMVMSYTRVYNTYSHHGFVNNKLCQTNLISPMTQEQALWQETKKMSYLDSVGFFDAVSHDILLVKFRKYGPEEAVVTDVKMFAKR